MRKLKYLILGIVTLVIVEGCDDEGFLTEKPKTIYTIESAFEKSSQVDAQIVRCYRAMKDLYGYGFEFFNYQNFLGGVGTDYFDITNFLCGYGASGHSNYANWTTTTGWINALWQRFYQMAAYANMAMMGAELVTWDDPDDKAYAIAQAKFFRGYAYLRLAECWGGVPLVSEYSEDLVYDYVRATREETYDFAIADLVAAVADLPDYPLQDGRVAKGAANHFLAEAYLGRGIETGVTSNYTQAIAAAQEVIDAHPLMTSRFGTRSDPGDTSEDNGVPTYNPDGNVYYDLFVIGNYDYSEGNTESVLVMQQPTYDEHQAADRRYQVMSLTRYVGPVFRDMRWRSDLLETGVDGCPWNGTYDTDKYPGGPNSAYCSGESIGRVAATAYISFDVWDGVFADDMRNDSVNICRNFICINQDHSLYGEVVTGNMLNDSARLFPLWSKISMTDEWGWHSSEVNHRTQYGRDYYAIRSAETYLIQAEAYMRNGDDDEAADAINAVRSRANASYLYASGDVDINAILDERAREVVYEEHRWPTLLRIGGDVMHDQLMNHAMYVVDQPYFTGDIDWRLWPIPEDVIQLNTGAVIDQNDGW